MSRPDPIKHLTPSSMTTDGQFEYVWDNADRLKEVRKDGEVVMTCRYDGTLGGAGGIGGILSCSTSATSTVYYHYDANGNVIACTDADGTLVTHLEYSPFGKVMLNSGSYVPRHQFSSKESDAAVGLNYYGYRFYAPSSGRWLNRDPIGEMGGINLYGFVDNDLLDNIDPLSLSIIGQIKSAYSQIKAAIALCASLPKYVDSPVIECPSIEGAYRHCWNNCVATRCSAWSPGAIGVIAGLGTWAELTNWHRDSLSDLLSNLRGIVNAFKISSCESSCTKTAQDSADRNCCPKNHAWDKSHPRCCP